jgi:hypothetical protein
VCHFIIEKYLIKSLNFIQQGDKKGMHDSLFRKGLFYFIVQHPSLPPPSKTLFIKVATKVAHGADLLLL